MGQSYEVIGLGIVLLTGTENFYGVGSLVVLLFRKGSSVCSLADRDVLVGTRGDLVGTDGLVYIVEHDAMTLDQQGLKSLWE